MEQGEMLGRLLALGVEHELTGFPDKVFTAQGVADVLGMKLSQVAKAMLFKVDKKGYGVAIVPGDRRVSLRALTRVCGRGPVSLASRDEVREATGLPVGAVTPLVKLCRPDIEVYVDTLLLDEKTINISTGNLRVGLSLAPRDLVRALDAVVAAISE